MGIKFESYRIFLDALRQPFFCNILNFDPVDARAIVEKYGINYETGAYLGDVGLKCTIAKYWEDFDASTTYSENKRWSRLVFDILLKVLYETSGQVQLLMTPDQVQADYPGLVTADGSAFLDPATGTPMELFNYFDPEFARRFFKAGTWQERHGKGRTFHSVTDIMAHALSQFHLHHP